MVCMCLCVCVCCLIVCLQAGPRVGVARLHLTAQETEWLVNTVNSYTDANGTVFSGTWPSVQAEFNRLFRMDKPIDSLKKYYYVAVKRSSSPDEGASGRPSRVRFACACLHVCM